MSSDERQEHILIEDDWCVELDYGQMSLAILYGLTGAKPPGGDLYDPVSGRHPNRAIARASRQSSKP